MLKSWCKCCKFDLIARQHFSSQHAFLSQHFLWILKGIWPLADLVYLNFLMCSLDFNFDRNIVRRPWNCKFSFSLICSLDLNDIGIGTDYPYICTKFGRHPLADPPFSLQMGGQDQLISCERFNRRPVEGADSLSFLVFTLRTFSPTGIFFFRTYLLTQSYQMQNIQTFDLFT